MTAHPFDQHYFHGGNEHGGYVGEGYRDFAIHARTAQLVLEKQPTSVLELGSARGYILKRLEDTGVVVTGLDISEHCRLTRVVEDVRTWNVTETPWPLQSGSHDLCLSVAVLEHIPEDKLPAMFAEMQRCCSRGLHGVDLHDDGNDRTHVTIRPIEWWRERMPMWHEVVDKEELERGPIPITNAPGLKLNLGCFTTMFYGWRNMDLLALGPWAVSQRYPFTQWHSSQGILFDDDVVDLVFASHFIEHLCYSDAERLLRDVRRALKPDGTVRILVPDAGKLTRMYLKAQLGRLDEVSSTAARRPVDDHAGRLYDLLVDGHQSIYDLNRLQHVLVSAGFDPDHIAKRTFRESRSAVMRRETLDLYPDFSLIVEAWK